jgi:ribosomal protein L11 methyltransferase
LKDTLVSLPLTPEQRAELRQSAGVDATAVDMPVSAFAAMALAGDAYTSGMLSTLPAAALLRLTSEQQEQLAAAGVIAETLAWSPRPAFRERWDDNFASFELCRDRLAVCNERTTGRPPAGYQVIRLAATEAGTTSFGTGRHPSTRLAARLLVGLVRGGERVLDVGTGSAILAIAALRLGAAFVHGIDIDADAIRLARRNVALNDLTGQVTLEVGEVTVVSEASFDVVVANLFPAILIDTAEVISQRVRPAGHAIVSGIVDARMPEVAGCFEALGFETIEQCGESGWTARSLRRRALG